MITRIATPVGATHLQGTRIKTRSLFGALIGLLLTLAGPLAHAELWCSGTIQRVLMYSDGTVSIVGSWRNDYTYICSTQGTWGTIATETCLSWYAAALKARADSATVTLYYGGSTGSYQCSTLPTYGAALVPGYFQVQN